MTTQSSSLLNSPNFVLANPQVSVFLSERVKSATTGRLMGCCGSSAEKPRQNPSSISYGQQGSRNKGAPPASNPNMGGGPAYPSYPQQTQPGYRQPPVQQHPQGGMSYHPGAPPNLGGGVVGSVPRIAGAGGPVMGGGALVFLGLYKYEARTAEDLSFDKGQCLLLSIVWNCSHSILFHNSTISRNHLVLVHKYFNHLNRATE